MGEVAKLWKAFTVEDKMPYVEKSKASKEELERKLAAAEEPIEGAVAQAAAGGV